VSVQTRRLGRLWPRTAKSRRAVTGYLFVSPFILGFLLWFLVPALVAVWLTFFDWNMIQDPTYVGLDNFREIFRDRLFIQSLKVTSYYTLVSVPLSLVLAFLIALLLNAKVRGMAVFRTIYYLPSLVPAVANAVLWNFVLNTEFGLVNALLRALGVRKIMWFQDPDWAIPALIIMSLWGLGGSVVIYLAGLQNISQDVYEAAEIDGVGWFRKFWNIELPLIMTQVRLNLVLMVIGTFQGYGLILVLFGDTGGPGGRANVPGLYMFHQAFARQHMGYACAIGILLFVIILTLTLVNNKLVRVEK